MKGILPYTPNVLGVTQMLGVAVEDKMYLLVMAALE